jgi:hypothetical protein
VWHRFDRLLATMRPQREPLSLVIDAVVVAIAWNATYLFRLGFERWISARPSYDHWVLLGVVIVYAFALWLLKVPKACGGFRGSAKYGVWLARASAPAWCAPS